jgi:hypothetical protein
VDGEEDKEEMPTNEEERGMWNLCRPMSLDRFSLKSPWEVDAKMAEEALNESD